MKVIGLAGYSGSGKTTLMERLLPRFKADGYRIAVVKQSHHDVEVDRPGKDSWRHRQAGAGEVLLTSPYRWMLVHELEGDPEPDLDHLLTRLSPCDLVMVEGFRHAGLPKLEVHRTELGHPWLHPGDPCVIAVVTDAAPPGDLPHFHADDVAAVYTYLLDTLGLRR